MVLSEIRLRVNGHSHLIQAEGMTYLDDLYVDYQRSGQGNYQCLQLTIHPKKDLIINQIQVVFRHAYAFSEGEKVFCNGFQSWSESREYHLWEQPEQLRKQARSFMRYYGDDHLDLPRRKGLLHSWTYSYMRQRDEKIQFIGSLNEWTGFTAIYHDTQSHEMIVEKDCQGLQLTHSYPALHLFMMRGSDQEVFDQYFASMECPAPKAPPASGWTSWYHYYNSITEAIILKNLDAFASLKANIDLFQIDDGYQTRVGDWLSIKPAFPRGMAALAKDIHHVGYRAGLWLAPFICEEKSDLFKQKKDWLLKDASGKPLKAGWNPLWSGAFYALDIYHPEVREYVTGLLYTVLQKWGYDLVKLDFLYAACILSRPNKTRGQVMYDAMRLLRDVCGEKWILGCGVPLGSAFGQVDYCRIGADIHLRWEHRLLKWLRNRERVSTLLALRCTLGRWQLNGRAFQNDPDVFLLRSTRHKLTPVQQHTLITVNSFLGSLLFTSDFPGDYSEKQWEAFQTVFHHQEVRIHKVIQELPDVYRIEYQNQGQEETVLVNLNSNAKTLHLGGQSYPIKPYQTIRIEPGR